MIREITAGQLRGMDGEGGLILQGCGGDLQEWLDGINQMFTEEGILRDGTRFQDAMVFQHDGLTNLLFPFTDDVKVNVGRLAMWRLRSHEVFGGTWMSDYVENKLGGFIQEQDKAQELDLGSDLEGLQSGNQ